VKAVLLSANGYKLHALTYTNLLYKLAGQKSMNNFEHIGSARFLGSSSAKVI